MAPLLTALRVLIANLEAMLTEVVSLLRPQHALLYRRFTMEQYLVYSTAVSVFLTVLLMHKGVDIFVGYPIVIVNCMILLAQDRLIFHRNHALLIFVVLMVSLVASHGSRTPAGSILAQVIGISVFSVYFFTMLTNSGLSVPRWMEVYAQVALAVAVWGVISFVLRQAHILPQTTQTRLRSFYAEPSLFVYATLPAFALYLNTYLRHKTHKEELGLFVLCYALADSSLGFLGILLIVFLAALPRLNFWRMLALGAAGIAFLVGLFFASSNFRLRVVDTVVAIAVQDISNTNATTFAMLSNAYVTFQTFVSHPLIGVGIGGYQFAYTKYMPFLGNNIDDPNMLTLNMFDANSLFLRTTAELGLFGLVLLIGFLVVCGRVKGGQYLDIRNALLPYMIIRMMRFGAWFSMELYFFVGLYLLNYMHYRAATRLKTMKAENARSSPHPAA